MFSLMKELWNSSSTIFECFFFSKSSDHYTAFQHTSCDARSTARNGTLNTTAKFQNCKPQKYAHINTKILVESRGQGMVQHSRGCGVIHSPWAVESSSIRAQQLNVQRHIPNRPVDFPLRPASDG